MIPRLPNAAWVVLAGDALSAVGSGMTLRFLLIDLHAIRGLSLTLAGPAIAGIALDAGIDNGLFAGLVAVSAGAALAARRLARHLHPGTNLIQMSSDGQ